METYHKLADLLLELETVLRKMDLWEMEVPTKEDLLSQEPFCIDTLSFLQWLKFILLPNFKMMIEQSVPLPTQCNISPMAEEYFTGETWKHRQVNSIIQSIKDIDELLSSTDNV
ncbi:YqcC family protein [Marinomonas sp. 15G1-11]|uniref:YqcC family protein n=1 Tax=Marinomonas phaeophyticola TaxID=3004091 RepID=A0ABT4JWU1_9GAMM|nr:YqcC family protein [Marinomonas sp. 15G1-11]MCZ2722825.1 YqcC family protein [Marinomonas sp. 15G1-11]